MSAAMDKKADALWYCLPASSYADMRAKLEKRLSRNVPFWEINNLIHYVRDNTDRLGWNIPHTKRGAPAKNKIIRMLHDGTGMMMFDAPASKKALAKGTKGTILHSASLAKRQQVSLMQAASLSSNPAYRNYIESLAEDFEALAKKAVRLAKILKYA